MNAKEKNTINQTFSLPIELVEELHHYIKSMERSAFVAALIKKGIEEKKEELRKDYITMGHDEEQTQMMKEWEDTIGDGFSEEK